MIVLLYHSSLLIGMIEDFRKKKVHSFLPISCLLAGLSIQLFTGKFGQAVFGMLPGMVLLIIGKVTKEAIGYGDGLWVLAGGVCTGFLSICNQLMLGMLFAALWSMGILIRKKGNRYTEIPFLPFLWVAGILCLLFIGGK